MKQLKKGIHSRQHSEALRSKQQQQQQLWIKAAISAQCMIRYGLDRRVLLLTELASSTRQQRHSPSK